MTIRRTTLAAFALLALLFFLTVTSPAEPTAPSPRELTKPERAGYAIGRDLALQSLDSFRRDAVTVDIDMLIRGFNDAINSDASLMDDIEMEQTLAEIEREVSTRIATQRMQSDPVFRAVAEENLRRAGEFLDAYAQRDGVRKLPNAVLYRVITSGEGNPVTQDSTVVVTYSARLTNGFEYARSESIPLHVSRMFPGAIPVVTRMRVGDRWEIVLPPEQALGIAGKLPDVGPNEAIILDARIDAVQP